MGKKSRTKGIDFERQIARDLKRIGYKNASRHLEYQQAEAWRQIDVIAGPLRVQCKRGKAYTPANKLLEVHTRKGEIPLLVTKADYKPTLVILQWEDFLRILEDVGIAWEGVYSFTTKMKLTP